MTEPIWLTIELVTAIQEEQLATFGGAAGLRAAGLLDSALDRPRNKFANGETKLTALVAAYAFGVARNHPFVDGNKRTALLSIYTFLGLNGFVLTAAEPEAVVMIQELAAGNLSETELAAWVETHVSARP